MDGQLLSHLMLRLGTPMLIAFAAGAFVGRAAGRSRVAQGLTVGATAVGGIGAALAAWVVIPGIPSTGGTDPHHYLPELTSEVLGYMSLGLMFLTPLVLGYLVGSVNSFRPDRGGWRRFTLCVTACVSVIAIGVFMFWVVTF